MSERAYVAGRFGDWQQVRQVQAVLRDAGYEITYDWTVHAEPTDAQSKEWSGELPAVIQRRAAIADLEAARTADLLVLVCEDDMAGALGCYIELGAAAAFGARLHIIAPPRGSIFWHLPNARTFCSREDWAAGWWLAEETVAA